MSPWLRLGLALSALLLSNAAKATAGAVNRRTSTIRQANRHQHGIVVLKNLTMVHLVANVACARPLGELVSDFAVQNLPSRDNMGTNYIITPTLVNGCLPRGLLCSRVFYQTLNGVSGLFSADQLDKLRSCLADGFIYHEKDGPVLKAEHVSLPPSNSIGHLTYGTRRQVLQNEDLTQEQTSLNGDIEKDPRPVNFQVDGGVQSVSKERAEWLLHNVGLSAAKIIQQQLSNSVVKGQAGGAAWQLLLPHLTSPGVPLQTVTLPMSGPEDEAQLLRVSSVMDQPVGKVEQLASALWNLDRIDQTAPPLDAQYRYGSASTPGTGKGVTIYSLDSGVMGSHQEFKSWGETNGSRVSYGYDFITNRPGSASDCDGHGTHTASTAIGRAVGVAKDANLVAVRILDCTGSGTISDTIAGLDWIASRHRLSAAAGGGASPSPGVVIMSLGVPSGNWAQSLASSVQSLIKEHGVSVVVASGNAKSDSCSVVPANVPETITVAASNLVNKFNGRGATGPDTMYSWSNSGTCVDVFAPGVEIYGACGSSDRCTALSDTAYTWASGTSMAVPHVAGLVAIYLSLHPNASPKQVSTAISSSAIPSMIQEDDAMLPGTPNRLLFTLPLQQAIQASGKK